MGPAGSADPDNKQLTLNQKQIYLLSTDISTSSVS